MGPSPFGNTFAAPETPPAPETAPAPAPPAEEIDRRLKAVEAALRAFGIEVREVEE